MATCEICGKDAGGPVFMCAEDYGDIYFPTVCSSCEVDRGRRRSARIEKALRVSGLTPEEAASLTGVRLSTCRDMIQGKPGRNLIYSDDAILLEEECGKVVGKILGEARRRKVTMPKAKVIPIRSGIV